MFQDTDPIHLDRLLTIGEERDSEQAARDRAEERASVH